MGELRSIVYVSHATQELSNSDLNDLLQVSRRNNARDGITGVLLFNQGRFIQCIEGPVGPILHTYSNIRRDDRHHNILELVNDTVMQRDFSSWTMGWGHLLNADFNNLLRENWPMNMKVSLPAHGSTGKQLLQIVWEQISSSHG